MKKVGLIALLITSVLMVGCSAPTIKKERGQFDLAFDKGEPEAAKDKTIAIVAPEFEQDPQNSDRPTSSNPLVAAAMAAQKERNYDFNTVFHKDNYADTLEDALADGFEGLVTKKGFTMIGPYGSFDEITYTDKKGAYLAVVPSVELHFNKLSQSQECGASLCKETGELGVSGEFSFKLIEPMTGQRFMTKRIDLSDLNVSEPYKYTYEKPKGGGLLANAIGGAMSKLSNESEGAVDNTDKAIKNAINDFYGKAMAKVDTYLSSEEIMSFESDVEGLKARKRY